jgi:hypothetical protein
MDGSSGSPAPAVWDLNKGAAKNQAAATHATANHRSGTNRCKSILFGNVGPGGAFICAWMRLLQAGSIFRRVSNLDVASVLRVRGSRVRRRLVVMVKYFANPPTCPLGDFAGALSGADADVLAGNTCALADIASGVERVKGDQVGRAFANTFGRRPGALRGSFADVSGTPADVAAGAGLMGLLLGGRLRWGGRLLRAGRLLRGLGLVVLTSGVQAEDSKCECEKRDGWFWKCGSHELILVQLDSMCRRTTPPQGREIGEKTQNAGVASPNDEEICELRLIPCEVRGPNPG